MSVAGVWRNRVCQAGQIGFGSEAVIAKLAPCVDDDNLSMADP
jgi:hypothetical protein